MMVITCEMASDGRLDKPVRAAFLKLEYKRLSLFAMMVEAKMHSRQGTLFSFRNKE